MNNMVKVLGIQLEPVISNKKLNIEKVDKLLDSHAWFKPDLIVLPEVFATGITTPEVAVKEAEKVPGEIYNVLTAWAKAYNCFLLGGSLIEDCEDGKCRNRSMLFAPDGKMIASYYKQHMFSHYGSTEGEFCTPGKETVVVSTPIGKIGMSVCYDLRFPELYRTLADNGAEIIVVPAAWPYPRLTHWITLNRARAIENQCFIIAVNQVGIVPPKRINVGNSMVIDPWGSIIAGAGEKEGVMMTEIDLNQLYNLREEFPILKDRNFEAYKNHRLYEYSES